MATYRENLILRRDAVAQKIADLSEQNIDLPDVSGPVAVAFTAKIDSLYRELERLESMIAAAEGGFEFIHEVDT